MPDHQGIAQASIAALADKAATIIATDAHLHSPEFSRFAASKHAVWSALIERFIALAIAEERASHPAPDAAAFECRFVPGIHTPPT
jgi:hypothetical protein